MIIVRAYYHMSGYKDLVVQLMNDGHKAIPRDFTTVTSPVAIDGIIGFPWPNWKGRGLNISFSIAEFLWIMKGSNRLDEIAFWNSAMAKFSDDNFTLYGAYGTRIIEALTNQIEAVIKKIRADRETRQAVVSIFSLGDLVTDSKDIPCTIAVHFMVENNLLNVYVHMRSNDVVLGFPYDWATFDFMAQYVASRLSIKCGTHYHFADSLHIYSNHFKFAEKAAFSEDELLSEEDAMPFNPFDDKFLQSEEFSGDKKKLLYHYFWLEEQIRTGSYEKIEWLIEDIKSRENKNPFQFIMPLLATKVKKFGIRDEIIMDKIMPMVSVPIIKAYIGMILEGKVGIRE